MKHPEILRSWARIPHRAFILGYLANLTNDLLIIDWSSEMDEHNLLKEYQHQCMHVLPTEPNMVSSHALTRRLVRTRKPDSKMKGHSNDDEPT